jgi:hypothetical protein
MYGFHEQTLDHISKVTKSEQAQLLNFQNKLNCGLFQFVCRVGMMIEHVKYLIEHAEHEWNAILVNIFVETNYIVKGLLVGQKFVVQQDGQVLRIQFHV